MNSEENVDNQKDSIDRPSELSQRVNCIEV